MRRHFSFAPSWRLPFALANVRYGWKADVTVRLQEGRYWPNADRLLCGNFGWIADRQLGVSPVA